MALEDNDNMDIGLEDTGPEGGNGDEKTNRTFKLAAVGLGALGVLGLILIAAIFIGSQGERNKRLADNAAVQATNAAVQTLAAITPVPTATDTPVPPTNTPTLVPTKPQPTAVPTSVPTVAPVSVVTGTTGTGGTPTAGTPKPDVMTAQAQSTKSALVGGTPGAKATTPTPTKPATQLTQTGAGDTLGLIAIASGLVAVLIVARRLRTVQA